MMVARQVLCMGFVDGVASSRSQADDAGRRPMAMTESQGKPELSHALTLGGSVNHMRARPFVYPFLFNLCNENTQLNNHDLVSAIVTSGSDRSLCLVHIRPSLLTTEAIHQCPSHPP